MEENAKAIFNSWLEKINFLSDSLDTISQPFLACSPDGTILKFNQAFCDLTGYSREELSKLNRVDLLMTPESFDMEFRALNIGSAHKPQKDKREYIKKDGTIVRVESLTRPALDPDGNVLLFYSLINGLSGPKLKIDDLRKSEERLEYSLNVAELGVWEMNMANKTTWRSPWHDRIFGYLTPLPEWSLEKLFEHVIPSERDDIEEKFRQAVAEHRDWNIECRIRRTDGEIRWIWMQGRCRYDDQGKPTRMVGIIQDITGRRNIEHMLRWTEKRLNFSLNVAELGAWDLDMINQDTWRSAWHDKIFGYHSPLPKWNLGMLMEHVLPEYREEVGQKFNEAAAEHGDWNIECRIRRADGEIRWIWMQGRCRYNKQDEPVRMVGIIQDITERKKIEHALMESEERSRATFEQAAVGIAHVDKECNFIKLNQRYCDIVGYPYDELIKLKVQDITHPEDNKATMDNFKRLYSGEIPSYIQRKRYIRKDGSTIWVNLTVSVVRDPDGHPKYFVPVIEDITGLIWAEKELDQKIKELERSNDELERFAYVASHDLQEPLRMVASYVRLLDRRYKDKLDEDAREFIAYAVEGSTRMQQMINDLLTYSRVGTKGRPFEKTDMEQVLERVLSNLSLTIKENNATVTHDPLPDVIVDRVQMEQLLQNLIGNAIRFHGEKPPVVHVSAEKSGEEWVFSVKDNGIGIEKEYFDRIFVIFQRLHPREEYPGTGIGLAICKKIVERHGGKIWVESEPGAGTTFFFSIPVKREEET